MRSVVLLFVLLLSSPSKAEEACPKYREGCVPLDTFKCETVTRSKVVNRFCYDPKKRYAIVWLGKKNTPYDYCDVPQDMIDKLQAASSMGELYNKEIRSKPDGEHGPYDCRDHPRPAY
jgi:hypothetical protein